MLGAGALSTTFGAIGSLELLHGFRGEEQKLPQLKSSSSTSAARGSATNVYCAHWCGPLASLHQTKQHTLFHKLSRSSSTNTLLSTSGRRAVVLDLCQASTSGRPRPRAPNSVLTTLSPLTFEPNVSVNPNALRTVNPQLDKSRLVSARNNNIHV